MPSYLPYRTLDGATLLGHYKVFHKSGALAATVGAAGHLARIRWAPGSNSTLLVLLKLRVGHTVSGAVTTAVETAYQAIVHRQYTVDHSTAITNTSMSGTANTNKARALTMGTSLMGASGPGIATTAVISGNTSSADAAPFAGVTFPNPSPTLGAAAVTNQVGVGTEMRTLYECNATGDHPVVLSNLEGVIVQTTNAGPASGTYAVYVEWTWAEVAFF